MSPGKLIDIMRCIVDIGLFNSMAVSLDYFNEISLSPATYINENKLTEAKNRNNNTSSH